MLSIASNKLRSGDEFRMSGDEPFVPGTPKIWGDKIQAANHDDKPKEPLLHNKFNPELRIHPTTSASAPISGPTESDGGVGGSITTERICTPGTTDCTGTGIGTPSTTCCGDEAKQDKFWRYSGREWKEQLAGKERTGRPLYVVRK